ncbi:MAG: hypothetical protein KJ077_28820 [Anaerolineae bacterium]|nr:hypothetical protein [Anaerolineae bacterium]
MGNRGGLHNEQGQIIRPYQGKRWIICQLQFKERRQALMVPGHYTELFFLMKRRPWQPAIGLAPIFSQDAGTVSSLALLSW